MQIVLTAYDHELNGFVNLAQWVDLTETDARALIQRVEAGGADESELKNATGEFSFILYLMNGLNSMMDSGARTLPTQDAMRLAPTQVSAWLDRRPDALTLNTCVPELCVSVFH